MDILRLIKQKDKLQVLKALKQFGEAQILAQELFADLKASKSHLTPSISPTYLREQSYDSLQPIQRQFRELFEYRDKLQDFLKKQDYPVLDRAITIPTLNIEQAIMLTQKLDEHHPHQSFVSLQPQATVVLSTENALSDTKRIVADMTGISADSINEIPAEKCPVLFAGMTTPRKTKILVEEIAEYLINEMTPVEQKDSDWVMEC